MKHADQTDHFLVPLVPLIPCLATLSTFGLCSGVPPKIWLYFLGFEIIGASFYFFYGINHSHLGISQKRKQSRKCEGEEPGEIEMR